MATPSLVVDPVACVSQTSSQDLALQSVGSLALPSSPAGQVVQQVRQDSFTSPGRSVLPDSLAQLEPRLVRCLAAVASSRSSLSSGLQLGVVPSSGGSVTLQDFVGSGTRFVGDLSKPLLPLLNTVFADKLKLSSLLLNWTSFDVAFTTAAEWKSSGRMVSSAAVFSPGGEARAIFSQHRADGRAFTTVIGAVPFSFDTSVPFGITFSSPSGAKRT